MERKRKGGGDYFTILLYINCCAICVLRAFAIKCALLSQIFSLILFWQLTMLTVNRKFLVEKCFCLKTLALGVNLCILH